MTIVQGIIGAAAILIAYKKLLTEEQRKALENWAKTHHFLYGLASVLAGIIIKSPTAIGFGGT